MSGKRLRRRKPAFAEPWPNDACKVEPDLAAIVTAWPELPKAIGAGILAMVKAGFT